MPHRRAFLLPAGVDENAAFWPVNRSQFTAAEFYTELLYISEAMAPAEEPEGVGV